jgi:hypothetical protein
LSSQLTPRSSLQEHVHCLSAWRETIKDYSGRSFTRQSDRLPALSGLATDVEQILGSGYVAGLWIKEILLELLWQNDEAARFGSYGTISKQFDSYVAPSWSWASYPGPINYNYAEEILQRQALYDDGKPNPQVQQAQVLEVCSFPEGLDPKGRLVGGYIRLRGRVRWFRSDSCHLPLQFKPRESAKYVPDEVWSTLESVDTSYVFEDYVLYDETESCGPTALLAISIISIRGKYAYGLALLPTAENNQFRRVGIVNTPINWFNDTFDTEVTII